MPESLKTPIKITVWTQNTACATGRAWEHNWSTVLHAIKLVTVRREHARCGSGPLRYRQSLLLRNINHEFRCLSCGHHRIIPFRGFVLVPCFGFPFVVEYSRHSKACCRSRSWLSCATRTQRHHNERNTTRSTRSGTQQHPVLAVLLLFVTRTRRNTLRQVPPKARQ